MRQDILHKTNQMEERNPQSASALYVPLPRLPKRHLTPQHSSTALRASKSAVFDRNKSRTLADKVSFTLTAFDDEGKCCRMLPCAAK